MRLYAALLLCLSLCAPLPALAQAEGRADRLAEAFFTLAPEGVGAEIVVTQGGSVVLDRAVGIEPGQPRALGSLSMSVTAQCLSGLVEAGRLRWQSPMSGILGWEGEGADITVAALVTQSAGLSGDRTRGAMPLWYDAAAAGISSEVDASSDWRAVASWPQEDRDAGGFAYSNENFALLGAVIEAVTGQRYENACNGVLPNSRLIDPVGRFGPFAGWQGRLSDYAVFQAILYGNRDAEGPASDLGDGVVYGLGMYGRFRDREWIWWHAGTLCLPGRIEATTCAMQMSDGWGVVMAMDSCPDFAQLAAMDRALWEAFGDEQR